MLKKIFLVLSILLVFFCGAQEIDSEEYSRIWEKLRDMGNNWKNGYLEMDYSGIFYYADKEISCDYFHEDSLDLNEPITMDSKIAANEILMHTATVTNIQVIDSEKNQSQNSSVIRKKYNIYFLPFKGKFAFLDYEDKLVGLSVIHRDDLFERFSGWKEEDFLLSLQFMKILRTDSIFDAGKESLIEPIKVCREYQSNLIDEQYYRIIFFQEHAHNIFEYDIRGQYLKQLFEFYELKFLRKAEPDNEQEIIDRLNELAESLSFNFKIPYLLKSQIIGMYIGNLSYKVDAFRFNWEEISNNLLYFISEYPQLVYESFEHHSEIDQYAFNNAVKMYSSKGLITGDELKEFSEKILLLDKNPQVNMLAYCALTLVSLEKGNFEDAVNYAITAMKVYDNIIHWSYFKEDVAQNTRPAVMCLAYLYETSADLQLIYKTIESFNRESVKFPEFRKMLLMHKFIASYMYALPNEDVLVLAKLLGRYNYPGYSFNGFDKYDGFYINPQIYDQMVFQLKNYDPEKEIIDKPYKIKKFLMSESYEVIIMRGIVEAKIILPQPKNIALKNYHLRSRDWRKAEINEEIYWICTD